MKMLEAVKNVIKTKENEAHADIDVFCYELGLEGLGWSDVWNARMTGYSLVRWLCTDTWVGTTAYFLDGVPVAVGHQSARKSSECLSFVSLEAAELVRSFIISLPEPSSIEKISLIDDTDEIDDFYSFDLTDYFLENTGFVDNLPVKITSRKWWPEDEKFRYISHHCVVELESGESRVVKAEEVLFPLRVTGETK